MEWGRKRWGGVRIRKGGCDLRKFWGWDFGAGSAIGSGVDTTKIS